MFMKIELVNDLLEKFYKNFYSIEEMSLKQGIKGLTTTELHVIEAIGNESLSMNELADKLKITMGTATVAINKLSKKEFIDRKRCNHDRRKVFVSLSQKGVNALSYHTEFHKSIISNITKNLEKNELESFMNTFEKILSNLEDQLEFIKPNIITFFPVSSTVKIIKIKGSPAVISYFNQNDIVEQAIVKLVYKTDELVKLELNGEIKSFSFVDTKNLIVRKEQINK